MTKSRFSAGLRVMRETDDPASVVKDRPEVFDKILEPSPSDWQSPSTPPSRIGRKAISGYFEDQVRRQFKSIAADKGVSQEALLAFSLNLCFVYFGREPIASSGERSRDPSFQEMRREHIKKVDEVRRMMVEQQIAIGEMAKVRLIERQQTMQARLERMERRRQKLDEQAARREERARPKES